MNNIDYAFIGGIALGFSLGFGIFALYFNYVLFPKIMDDIKMGVYDNKNK